MEVQQKISNLNKRKPQSPVKFKIELNEEQKAAKTIIYENPVILLKGMAGSGKAQPLSSIVYTPSGPKKMGELVIGEQVLGLDGPVKVLGVYPQGKEDVYEITCSDKSTVKASLDHLWTVCKKSDLVEKAKWKTVTTQDLLSELEKGVEYRLPRITLANFDSKEVPIDPYLLGILIAEGHIREDSVSFSTSDTVVLSSIENILANTDSTVRHILNYDYSIKKRQRDNKPTSIMIALRDLELTGKLSYDKFIPDIYKYNTEKVRVKLLQGLIDGDGYVTKKGRLLYGTSSEVLAKDVTEVFQSLGGRVTSCSYFPKYRYKGEHLTSIHLHYELSITIEDSERFATIPRKYHRLVNKENKVKYLSRIIKKVEKVGYEETQCIKVDAKDSLYLTNSFIVTHNTLVACQAALDLFFKREVEKIIITRPTVAKEDIGFLPGDMKEKMDPWLAPVYANLYMLYNKEAIDKMVTEGTIEIVPFAFMRGRTFPNAVVLVDECQNITHTQTEMMLGRLGKGGKMIFCGDLAQIDLKNKKDSGISFFLRLEEHVPGVRILSLKTNHRHEVVESILSVYSDYRD